MSGLAGHQPAAGACPTPPSSPPAKLGHSAKGLSLDSPFVRHPWKGTERPSRFALTRLRRALSSRGPTPRGPCAGQRAPAEQSGPILEDAERELRTLERAVGLGRPQERAEWRATVGDAAGIVSALARTSGPVGEQLAVAGITLVRQSLTVVNDDHGIQLRVRCRWSRRAVVGAAGGAACAARAAGQQRRSAPRLGSRPAAAPPSGRRDRGSTTSKARTGGRSADPRWSVSASAGRQQGRRRSRRRRPGGRGRASAPAVDPSGPWLCRDRWRVGGYRAG